MPRLLLHQDNFLATLSSDWRYERSLQGIRLLASHAVGPLVNALIGWRQAVNENIKRHHSANNVVNLAGVCKRVRARECQQRQQGKQQQRRQGVDSRMTRWAAAGMQSRARAAPLRAGRHGGAVSGRLAGGAGGVPA